MTPNTAPAPGTLSQLCAAALRANGALMASLLQSLSAGQKEALQRLLTAGGSVGIETLVDKNAANRVLLVGLEREGSRLVLAEVATSTGQAFTGYGILAPEPRGGIH
jgi:hypothetical protein